MDPGPDGATNDDSVNVEKIGNHGKRSRNTNRARVDHCNRLRLTRRRRATESTECLV